jgi:hypothetical protein
MEGLPARTLPQNELQVLDQLALLIERSHDSRRSPLGHEAHSDGPCRQDPRRHPAQAVQVTRRPDETSIEHRFVRNESSHPAHATVIVHTVLTKLHRTPP